MANIGKRRNHKMGRMRRLYIMKYPNMRKWLTIAVILSAPHIALFVGMQYFISESISTAEKLSLHIATGSLSVTIVIALLVYWLQKIDEGKERRHRRNTAMTAMRYAIENGIAWLIGVDGDAMLGAAATIKEIVNQYRQELLDVLSQQEYNDMILVVEGINDEIRAFRNEGIDAHVTEDNRAKMFLPWINIIRWSRYRSYLAMTEDYHDLLSQMMINLLNALGGLYSFQYVVVSVRDKDKKPLLEWNGEKITIHQGEELVLDGSFDVDEASGLAWVADGWAKDDEYIGYYTEGKRNGKGCAYGINGEKLKDGTWDMGEFISGIEYDWLIHVDQGELIYNSKENDYDTSDDFAYSAYEQYGMNIIPFMNSETYIVHDHLADYYVADLKVDGDTEQLVNIRTLEQYLAKKNPKRLQDLKEMMELENCDEYGGM